MWPNCVRQAAGEHACKELIIIGPRTDDCGGRDGGRGRDQPARRGRHGQRRRGRERCVAARAREAMQRRSAARERETLPQIRTWGGRRGRHRRSRSGRARRCGGGGGSCACDARVRRCEAQRRMNHCGATPAAPNAAAIPELGAGAAGEAVVVAGTAASQRRRQGRGARLGRVALFQAWGAAGTARCAEPLRAASGRRSGAGGGGRSSRVRVACARGSAAARARAGRTCCGGRCSRRGARQRHSQL